MNESKIRVAFSPTIFRSQTQGGISRYFFQLIAGLIKLEQDVFIGGYVPNNYYFEELKNMNLTFGKISNVWVDDFMMDNRNPFAWAPKSLKNYKPNIVHETFYSTKWFRKVEKETIKILTIYDLIDEKNLTSLKYSKKKEAIDLADHLICISESTKEDLVHYFKISEKKISVIRLAPFPLNNVGVSETKTIELRGDPYFLFIGQRMGYKNFSLLLDAFNLFSLEFPKFKLVAVGGGPFSTLEIEYLKSNNLFEKIIQIEVNDSELAQVYSNSLCLVYPSLWEGFGMPPLEAFEMGTRIIASNHKTILEILGKFNAEYFNPLSKLELLTAMRKVAIDFQRGTDWRSNIRKLPFLYSWNKCVEETLALYERILFDHNPFSK